MFHRETDAAKVARNRDAIFDLQARALAWLEDYTGIPYPFGKFDFVLIPSFQFGGMEHPGAVFYNASGLLLDESATQNQLLGRASLISHETAHMWFGDLVTMKWFNDVWMKEVFANFMAAKIVNPSFPAVNHDLRFLFQHYPSAYDVDRTEGANPIRQPLANLNEAGSLYGAIIYQKAPIVMRQLELLVGADAVPRRPARVSEGAHVRQRDVERPDRRPRRADRRGSGGVEPRVGRGTRPARGSRCAANAGGGATTVTLEESDPLGRGLVWPQQLDLAVGYAGRVDHVRVDLAGQQTVTIPAGRGGAPRGCCRPAAASATATSCSTAPNLEALATALPHMPDPLLRGAALVTLWESMLEGRISPARMQRRADRGAAGGDRRTEHEPDARVHAHAVLALHRRRRSRGRWRRSSRRCCAPGWTAPRPPARRPRGSARCAASRRRRTTLGLARAASGGATSGFPKLPLAETDEADLALDLAVRDVPHAAEILTTQLERFKNPDRKARFAFVRPARLGRSRPCARRSSRA